MDQAVYETLTQVLSTDSNLRISAELRLKELEKLPALNLKKYVNSHWSSKAEQFTEPEPDEKTKSVVREMIFNALSDHNSKIRVVSAYVVSRIAQNDWPDAWPNLIILLISLLKTGSPNHVHGAMRVLTEFVDQEVTENQFSQIAPILFPELFRILHSNELYSFKIRARAVSIFKHCLEILVMLKEEHPEATESFITPILPQWLQLFVNTLKKRTTGDERLEYEEYGLKLEIIKCINFSIPHYPKLVSPHLISSLEAIWTDLSKYVRQSSDSTDYYYESDGEPIGFEHLLYAQFEFIGLCIRKKTTQNVFIGNNGEATLLKEIIWIIIEYMKMTQDQAETWLNDSNQFIEEDDEDTHRFTIRVSAEELLQILLDKFPEQAFQALQEATQKHIEESHKARVAGDPAWWKIQEACLKAIGFISEELIAAVQEKDSKLNFDIAGLFNNVVLALLSMTEQPFLQGRAFVFVSQFASILPVEHASKYVEAAVTALQQNGAIPLQVSALRALQNFCRHMKRQYVAPHQEKIIECVASLLKSTTEDTLILALETLEASVKVDKEKISQYEHVIGPLIIEVWSSHANATIVDLFELLASDHAMNISFQARALPSLANAITNPANPDLTASAIDLIKNLVKASSSSLPDGYIQHIFPPLMHLLLTTENRDILQSGEECLKFFVMKDCMKLAQWNDGTGKTGLDYIIELIAKLLQPSESESAALFLGELIIKLIQKAGDLILVVLPDLLKAVATRLETAQTPTFIQSMVMIFAHLFNSQLETVVNFLSEFNVNGRAGLEILLNTCAMALTKLFLSGDPRMQNIQVRGDLIISGSTRIMTRSQTRQNPDKYTSVPATEKIIKLLLSDLQNAIEIDSLKKPENEDQEDEEEAGDSDDDDGEWEDVDELSPFAPAEDYRFLEILDKSVDLDDAENDLDIQNDPVYQMNIKEYLINFFRHCASQNVNNFLQITEKSLNQEEKLKLQSIITAK
ncbi:6245_t:CDS:10 [Ambispora gerdemannii]|uniref:6245_t:CDS:1 n=1 Tax=Ambispora gerdemannii TaxID=144530 RepID=A0A9N8VF85_9GLOM|nr:6245_t:CDS:10 [Ambispora gerdemannii]